MLNIPTKNVMINYQVSDLTVSLEKSLVRFGLTSSSGKGAAVLEIQNLIMFQFHGLPSAEIDLEQVFDFEFEELNSSQMRNHLKEKNWGTEEAIKSIKLRESTKRTLIISTFTALFYSEEVRLFQS